MARKALDNELLTAAQEYASLGWRVLPLADRDKKPRLAEWQVKATTDTASIQEWWTKWPNANVGVALGVDSKLVGVDIDSEDGEKSLAELAGDDLPDTLEMVTGGGRRLLYKIPKDLAAPPITTIITCQAGELRFQSDGGQCVMPPSIHPGNPEKGVEPGRVYHWVEGRSHRDIHPAYMPGWLIVEMCRPKVPAWSGNNQAASFHAPGSDFNRRASFEDLLAKHGFKSAGQVGKVKRFTRPGKDKGISVTLGHYQCKDGTPGLYVFSSSIPGLTPMKCYDQFGVYAALEHAGDFTRAAAALKMAGYGQKAAVVGGHVAPKGTVPATTEPEPWGDPIPLRAAIPAPQFPLEVFPFELQEFAKSVAYQVQAPIGYVASTMLGVAAGAIGATVRIRLKQNWDERACLYVAIVAPKSSKKTPIHVAIMRPLKQAQAQSLASHDEKKQVYFVTDTTTEALSQSLKDKPRGLLLAADELSGFVEGMNQYKGGKGNDRSFWLSCWSGTAIHKKRVNPVAPDTYVPDPCISIVGGVQYAVLHTCFSTDDGFAERFLFEASDPMPQARVTDGEYLYEDCWEAVIKGLAKLEMTKDQWDKPRPTILRITDEAWQMFGDWTEENAQKTNDPDRDRPLDGFRSKANGYAGRLALVTYMIKHVENGGGLDPMTGEEMEAGVKLARYYLDQVVRARGGSGTEQSPVERVLTWIAKCGKKRLTRRDIHKGLWRQFKAAEELNEPLKRLTQHGWLRYGEAPFTPGRRPDAIYEVHPDLCTLCPQVSTSSVDTLNLSRAMS